MTKDDQEWPKMMCRLTRFLEHEASNNLDEKIQFFIDCLILNNFELIGS